MKPDLIYVLYKLDRIYSEKLPDIVLQLIKQGLENDYLIEIAGLINPTKGELGDLVEKAFENFVDHNLDYMKMALILARGINENEIEPYEGAQLIGEISERLNRLPELWNFKCNVIEFDDLDEDKGVSGLTYNSKNIEIWQNEIIQDIKRDSKLLVEKYFN